MNLKHILTNKIVVYLGSRYLIYGLQFITSLIIAGKLGPYYFGIYGFVLLLLSYFSQIHLGIPNSLNVLMVHNKSDRAKCDNYVANSLFIYIYFTIVIAVLYILYCFYGFAPIDKYHVDSYLLSVCVIAILVYISGVLTCVLRVRNQINQLSLVTSINAILNIICVVLFSEEQLIISLIVCLIISNVLTIIISFFNNAIPPIKEVSINKTTQVEILRKGIWLFFYNTCFYFIVISIRSIISANYSIEEFGAFTFSFTVASAVMMLLDSMQTIMFPKMVDKLSSTELSQVNHSLDIIRVCYVSAAHFMVYLAMIFFPILTIYILPEYSNTTITLNLISLAVLMNANSCGYSTLLIAQNKEKYSAFISVVSLCVNIIIGLLLVHVFHVGFSLVFLATMITYLLFSFLTVYWGDRLITGYSIKETIRSFFPLKLFIPFVVAFVISVLDIHYLAFIPLIIYLIFNIKDLKRIISYGVIILNNDKISDIQND